MGFRGGRRGGYNQRGGRDQQPRSESNVVNENGGVDASATQGAQATLSEEDLRKLAK